jgi:hypothetical protein
MKAGTCLVSMTDPLPQAASIFFPPSLSVYQKARGFPCVCFYAINTLALYIAFESPRLDLRSQMPARRADDSPSRSIDQRFGPCMWNHLVRGLILPVFVIFAIADLRNADTRPDINEGHEITCIEKGAIKRRRSLLEVFNSQGIKLKGN